MSMEQALAAALGINPHGRDHDDEAPSSLPEVQIATMREYCALYQEPCRFKVGDLVTPRKGTSVKGAGDPHIVIEVFDEPIRPVHAERAGTPKFYGKMDIRVMCMTSGCYASFCVESFEFEPYEGAE